MTKGQPTAVSGTPQTGLVVIPIDDAFSSFFVQRLHEALFDYSADSFKASALNSHLRVIELRRIGGQAEHHEFINSSIDSFFDELSWSIQSDPILRGGKKLLIQELVTRVKSGWGKSPQFLPAISALTLQFKEYLTDLTSELRLESAKEEWSKDRVLKLLDSLIVELELVGYPRPYIYSVTQKISIQRKKKSSRCTASETVELFLSNFTLEPRTFIVRGNVSTAIAKAVTSQPNWTVAATGAAAGPAQISVVHEFNKGLDRVSSPVSLEFKIETLCQHRAARNFFYVLDRFNEQIRFLNHHLPVHIHNKAICIDVSRNSASVLRQSSSPLNFTARTSEEDLDKGLQLLNFFFGESQLSEAAKARLAQAIEYHGAALTSKRHEEQLLNLWSCLEGFVGVPSSAGSKIAFVREAVLSCLTLQYPQRLFSLIANRVAELMGEKHEEAFWKAAEVQSMPLRERLAMVLLHPSLVAKRDELAAFIATRDPVLLFRLFELRKRFETPKVTKETLLKHREKISWQMNRIYWNRNLIVHSAESLPYLPTLVEHLHIYVDSFLGSILYVVATLEASTIPSVLELFSVHEKIRNTELSKHIENNALAADNLLDWIFGRENILRQSSGI